MCILIIILTTGPYTKTIDQVNTNVIYKFKSVTIGNDTTYYTIEDAIFAASNSTDEILIRANTIFAEKEVAEKVYDYSDIAGYELNAKLTISYYDQDQNYIKEFNDSESYTDATARTIQQITLTVSENIYLNVLNGAEIFINAERYTKSTNVTGIVDGNKYGVMILQVNSKIILNTGSTFRNYGFSAGEGVIESREGSSVIEFLTIFDYKGGSITAAVYKNAIPMLYFAPLSITNKINLVKGSIYQAYAFVTASSERIFTFVNMLNTDSSMFELTSGTLTKSVSYGKANFIFDNAEVKLLAQIKINLEAFGVKVTFDANDKDVALGSFYNIVIQNNSIINQEASIMLIGGSTIHVDSTSTINMNSKLFIDESYVYTGVPETNELKILQGNAKTNAFYDYDFIYNQTQQDIYYQYDTITKNTTNRSHIIIDDGSTINVGTNGKIAGYVNDDTFDLLDNIFDNGNKEYTIKRIKGSGLTASAPDVTVIFGRLSDSTALTEGTGGGGGSPFLYSEDENGNLHFEHEPISYKMLKSVEGTSYGTIRLLQDQNGVYYIQVVEEGSSITVLDNVQLYAVDYIDDGTILDLFFDILGNPHTIREKLTPVTFTDQYGISYLDEILSLDGNIAAPDTTRDDVLTYLTATFNKPENADFAKLMVSVMDGGSSQTVMMEMFSLFNAPQNLWWLDQALAHQDAQPLIQNVFNSIHVKVQVWDGIKWIDQGLIEAGSYLMEEFLVPIDLTGIETENLIVRFVFPTKCAFMFDSVAIDFTPDSEMNIIELDLISAIMNGNVDVIDKVMSINGEYVTLDYKEDVTFGFAVLALQEGYSRGFGVSMTGYIYAAGCTVTDELQPLMEGKTFEEIVDIIIASGRQELIDDIEMVSNFYYTITALGSLEYEDLLRELFNFMPQEEWN